MELIAGDVEAFHLGFADLDALLIAARVECALDFQTGLGRRRSDQLDHGKAIRERPAAPVLRDVAEQPVLSSRAEEFHPRALPEPYLNLSIHTAPDVRPPTCRNLQWTKRFGLMRTTRSNQSRAP